MVILRSKRRLAGDEQDWNVSEVHEMARGFGLPPALEESGSVRDRLLNDTHVGRGGCRRIKVQRQSANTPRSIEARAGIGVERGAIRLYGDNPLHEVRPRVRHVPSVRSRL